MLGSCDAHDGRRAARDSFAAALCLVNMLFAWRFLRESRDMAEAAESKAQARSVAVARRDAARRHALRRAGVAADLDLRDRDGRVPGRERRCSRSSSSARFGVTEKTIGFFFTYIGAISRADARADSRPGWWTGTARRGCRASARAARDRIASLAFMRPLADPAGVAAMLGDVLP